jgi:hypothetical protein
MRPREYSDECQDAWEGLEASEPDDDSEAAQDFYLRRLGVDTDKYIGEDCERD